MAQLVSSVPLSETIVVGLPRLAMMRSSSRATRTPDNDVSAMCVLRECRIIWRHACHGVGRMRLLVVLTIGAQLQSSASLAGTYVVSRDLTNPHQLSVQVERQKPLRGTRLVLRGAAMAAGISSQVVHPHCGARALALASGVAGTWLVPAGCRDVAWTVRLASAGTSDAGEQQSIISQDGSACLFSEASSLPRLADATGQEFLSVSGNWRVFPAPELGTLLVLPDNSRAPLFVILGAHPVRAISSGSIALAYFMDDARKLDRVAPVDLVMRGLKWLAIIAPQARNRAFNYFWIGLPSDAPSFGGATGSGVILVNYARANPQRSSSSTMTRAVPLIEATHQFGGGYAGERRPTWVEESLAVYFGLQALGHAEPHSNDAQEMIEHLATGATRYQQGLIAIQRQVNANHRSQYPAFFTKGVAFWLAVDRAVRASGQGGLDSKLPLLWTAHYASDGRPPSTFAASLGIPQPKWTSIFRAFLQ